MTSIQTSNVLPLSLTPAQLQQGLAVVDTIDSLLEKFGANAVGNAAAQEFLGNFAKGLKEMIANSDLPPAIKDMANAQIDQHLQDLGVSCPCSPEVSEAVTNSELGPEICEHAQEALDEAGGEGVAEESTSAAPASGTTQSAEATAEAEEEQANEGTATAASGSDSARADADAALDDQMTGLGESSETKKTKGGGKNFLEILAESMGLTQAKFLNEALKHSKTMESLAGDSEKADEFTIAQSKYTAAMQMFNIYSNQVATTLKTFGEAMSAISRKQ